MNKFEIVILDNNGDIKFREYKLETKKVVLAKYNQLCSEGSIQNFQANYPGEDE